MSPRSESLQFLLLMFFKVCYIIYFTLCLSNFFLTKFITAKPLTEPPKPCFYSAALFCHSEQAVYLFFRCLTTICLCVCLTRLCLETMSLLSWVPLYGSISLTVTFQTLSQTVPKCLCYHRKWKEIHQLVYMWTFFHLTHQFVLTPLTPQGITIATSHSITHSWSYWEHTHTQPHHNIWFNRNFKWKQMASF